jgi:iron complex transport system substrate-binding protein
MQRPHPLPAIAVGLLALASCGVEGEVPADAEAPTAAATSPREARPEITPEQGFPAKVRSFTGDVVLLEAPPRRIIAGNASVLDGLAALVEPDRIAALPDTALRYSLLAEDPGGFGELPRLESFEAEAILAPRPDLVLVHGYQRGTTVDRVLERGVPLVVLPAVTSWTDTLEGLRTLARLVGEDERGARLVDDLEGRRRRLQEPAARSGLTVLPYGNYGAGGSTAGAGTTWQVMIELAGMRNAATEAGLVGHPGIDFEQILAIQPDFFLVGDGADGEAGSAETVLRAEAALGSLEAVREGRFLRLPEALYSTSSHHVLTAAEALAAQAEALLAGE